jgi:hypothetical protein
VALAFELPARLGETGAPDAAAASTSARRVVDDLLARLPELRERIFRRCARGMAQRSVVPPSD